MHLSFVFPFPFWFPPFFSAAPPLQASTRSLSPSRQNGAGRSGDERAATSRVQFLLRFNPTIVCLRTAFLNGARKSPPSGVNYPLTNARANRDALIIIIWPPPPPAQTDRMPMEIIINCDKRHLLDFVAIPTVACCFLVRFANAFAPAPKIPL